MFKYKVSIYLKSGNVLYLRLKDISYSKLSGNTKEINWENGNFRNMSIDMSQVECIIVKNWWQKWG